MELGQTRGVGHRDFRPTYPSQSLKSDVTAVTTLYVAKSMAFLRCSSMAIETMKKRYWSLQSGDRPLADCHLNAATKGGLQVLGKQLRETR